MSARTTTSTRASTTRRKTGRSFFFLDRGRLFFVLYFRVPRVLRPGCPRPGWVASLQFLFVGGELFLFSFFPCPWSKPGCARHPPRSLGEPLALVSTGPPLVPFLYHPAGRGSQRGPVALARRPFFFSSACQSRRCAMPLRALLSFFRIPVGVTPRQMLPSAGWRDPPSQFTGFSLARQHLLRDAVENTLNISFKKRSVMRRRG